MRKIALVAVLLMAFSATYASAEDLKVVSWNISWLTAKPNGNNPRTKKDYDRLAVYARSMDADIIAFQEVENAAVAYRLLGDDYDYYFSNRLQGPQRTGFAVRNNVEVVEAFQFTPLDVGGVRYGVDITVQSGDQQLRLLNVHLKSGCFEQSLRDSSRDCQKLARQIPELERWIDDRAKEYKPFVVLGDFNRRLSLEVDNSIRGVMHEINDLKPNDYADLSVVNAKESPECWNGQYKHFIDYFLVDPRAKKFLVPRSFKEYVYKEKNKKMQKVLSDHCPIAIRFNTSVS